MTHYVEQLNSLISIDMFSYLGSLDFGADVPALAGIFVFAFLFCCCCALTNVSILRGRGSAKWLKQPQIVRTSLVS